jgi:hypothetical protein
MKYNRTFIRLEKMKAVDIIYSGPTSQYLTTGINFITLVWTFRPQQYVF